MAQNKIQKSNICIKDTWNLNSGRSGFFLCKKKRISFGLRKNFIANINILGYLKNINLLQKNDNFRCFLRGFTHEMSKKISFFQRYQIKL